MKKTIAMTLASAAMIAVAKASEPTEATLREADAVQMAAGAASDPVATEAIQHPNYLGNAPNNRIVDAAAVRQLMASGRIASQGFTRAIERVAITGDVGVVMGSEEVVAAAGSISANDFAPGLLQRRFTNVYLFADGHWRLLARHANVTPKLAQ